MTKSQRKTGSATQATKPPQPVQAVQQVQVPLVYADAIGNVLMSPINSRLTLVLNVGPAKDGTQPSVPTMEVVIPTPALLQFGKQLRELMRDRGESLANSYVEASKQLLLLTKGEETK
jgi:hypothetical protein